MIWKHSFMNVVLGSNFYDTFVKPKKIEELKNIEKEKLPGMQPLVDWEKKNREDKDKRRFGIEPESIPRPQLSKIQLKQIFPCVSSICRGFVSAGVCGTCKIDVCILCRKKKESNHICNTDDVQSIAMIQHETKQCPRCTTYIFRTMGCNHMYCTNCQTHFDWVSGEILKTSSNGHYLGLQQFANDVVLIKDIDGKEMIHKDFSFSLMYPSVLYEKMILKIDLTSEIKQSLYEDANCIRLFKRKKLVENEMELEYKMKVEETGIKYLLNEITEQQWGRNLYILFKTKEKNSLMTDVFNMYLSSVDSFLNLLWDESGSKEKNENNQLEIIKKYRKLVQLCNESLESIQKEYGGILYKFRQIDDDLESPSLLTL